MTEADLKSANKSITNINDITPGEKIHVPGDAPNTTYHVVSGDTGKRLFEQRAWDSCSTILGTSIAKDDHTTFQKLEKLNPNVTWTDLIPGSTLIVPRD